MIQNNSTNNISFSGKQVFVSSQIFAKIFNEHIKESNFVGQPWNLSTVKKDTAWLGTSDINTCTGIVLNNGSGLVQHYMTSDENFNNIKNINKLINDFISENPVKSALLIGSKNKDVAVADFSSIKSMIAECMWESALKPVFDPNSSKLFKELKNFVIDLKPTIFEGHRSANTRSHVVQDVKNDTNYIMTYIDNIKGKYIESEKDLDLAFENISISPNDKISFLA